MLRQAIEQTMVYGILLLMLAVLILFGLTTAEKGVYSLVGKSDTNQQAVTTTTPPAKAQPAIQNKTKLQILGKDQHGSVPTWSRQLSHNLEGHDSVVADAIDGMSLQMGTWLQAGSKKLLSTLSGWIGP